MHFVFVFWQQNWFWPGSCTFGTHHSEHFPWTKMLSSNLKGNALYQFHCTILCRLIGVLCPCVMPHSFSWGQEGKETELQKETETTNLRIRNATLLYGAAEKAQCRVSCFQHELLPSACGVAHNMLQFAIIRESLAQHGLTQGSVQLLCVPLNIPMWNLRSCN